jgi:hypothetical protein
MWTRNQAQFFQVRHDVSNRGWRQIQARRTRKRPRSHGLPISDVTLDQGFEQQLGTVIEHGMILLL